MRPGAQERSEGKYVDQPVLSTTPLADSIQHALPAAGETSNNTLDKGVPLLVTEEEEVASKTSEETVHPSREEEVAKRRSEGSIHCDREEEIVETLLSPKDKGSAIKATPTPVIKALPAELAEIPSEYWSIFMAPTTSTIDFPIRDLGTGAPDDLYWIHEEKLENHDCIKLGQKFDFKELRAVIRNTSK